MSKPQTAWVIKNKKDNINISSIMPTRRGCILQVTTDEYPWKVVKKIYGLTCVKVLITEKEKA